MIFRICCSVYKLSSIFIEFHSDQNLTKQWDTSPLSKTFNVTRNGTPGVTTDAKVTLAVTKDIPERLYYTLDPISKVVYLS